MSCHAYAHKHEHTAGEGGGGARETGLYDSENQIYTMSDKSYPGGLADMAWESSQPASQRSIVQCSADVRGGWMDEPAACIIEDDDGTN